jgi:thiol-disulfide isomerase/thioredoxin
MTLVLMVVVIAGAFLAYQWFAAKQNPTAAVVPETEAETEPDQETPEEELVFAGDFTVYDMAGNEVKLSDFRGQPLVVNFWASWCPPCVGEMPDFNQVWQDRQEDVMFMMVNVVDGQRETEESGKEYFRNEGYSFPVYFDLDQDAVATFGIYSYPQSFFIDKHGYFVAYAKGAIDADTLKMAIDMTIEAGEKRQPPPEAGETAPRAAY